MPTVDSLKDLQLLDATILLFFGVRGLQDPRGQPPHEYLEFLAAVALNELELRGRVRCSVVSRKSALRTRNVLSVELLDSTVRQDPLDQLIATLEAAMGEPRTLGELASQASKSLATLHLDAWHRLVGAGWIIETPGKKRPVFELADPHRVAEMRRELIQTMTKGTDLKEPERVLVALLAARGGLVAGSGYVWSRAPGAKSAVRALNRAVKAEGLPPLDNDAVGRAIDNARAVMEQLPVAKVLCEEGLRARRGNKLGEAARGGFDAANP